MGAHLLAAAYDGDGSHTPSRDQTSLRVIYRFSGFLQPIDNLPTVNLGKAGRTYPVKWQLQDAAGAYLSQLSAVQSILQKKVDCSNFSSNPTDAIEAGSAGNSSLRYDAAANQFVYNWQTPTTAGCYVLFLTLDDGQTYQANFDLRK